MDKVDAIIQREKGRAQEKAKHADSFIARNYWLWVIVAFIAYPLAATLSAFTEGANIFYRLEGTGVAWPATIALVLLIEVLVFFLGKGIVDDIQIGIFSKSTPDIFGFFVKVVVFGAVLFVSITQSLAGSELINERYRAARQDVNLQLVSIDSINGYYDQRIAEKAPTLAALQNTTYRGKITRTANKGINDILAANSKLEDQRGTALLQAQATNAQLKADYDQQTAENSTYALRIAGVGQAICVFCLIFIGIYDDGVKREAHPSKPGSRAGGSSTNATAPPIGYHHTPANSADPNESRPKIGFRMPWLEEPTAEDTSHRAGSQWPHVATGVEVENLPDSILTWAMKYCKASERRWVSKANGTEETNNRHRQTWRDRQAWIQSLMKNRSDETAT